MVVDYTKRDKTKRSVGFGSSSSKSRVRASASSRKLSSRNAKKDRTQNSSRTVKRHSKRSDDSFSGSYEDEHEQHTDGPFDYTPNFFSQLRPALMAFVAYIFYISAIPSELTTLDYAAGVLIMFWFGGAARASIKRFKASVEKAFSYVNEDIEELYLAGDVAGAVDLLVEETGLSPNVAERLLPAFVKSKSEGGRGRGGGSRGRDRRNG